MLYVIAQGKTGGYDMAANGFAQNGWSAYSMVSAFLLEMAGTFIFVM
jgi:aquaporin Z